MVTFLHLAQFGNYIINNISNGSHSYPNTYIKGPALTCISIPVPFPYPLTPYLILHPNSVTCILYSHLLTQFGLYDAPNATYRFHDTKP